MKLYEKMRPGENLSWCKPLVSDDEKTAIIQNEGEIISAMIDGKLLDIPNDEVAKEIEKYDIDIDDLHETGCANCPFRDECDAMDVDED